MFDTADSGGDKPCSYACVCLWLAIGHFLGLKLLIFLVYWNSRWKAAFQFFLCWCVRFHSIMHDLEKKSSSSSSSSSNHHHSKLAWTFRKKAEMIESDASGIIQGGLSNFPHRYIFRKHNHLATLWNANATCEYNLESLVDLYFSFAIIREKSQYVASKWFQTLGTNMHAHITMTPFFFTLSPQGKVHVSVMQ
jgi:hypothetical protein